MPRGIKNIELHSNLALSGKTQNRKEVLTLSVNRIKACFRKLKEVQKDEFESSEFPSLFEIHFVREAQTSTQTSAYGKTSLICLHEPLKLTKQYPDANNS